MISVIVPVYNIEKYIDRCIESVLNQTFSDFELLLINDGSTDSGPEICRAREKKDARVRLITKENGGVSSARNLGLELAKGSHIFFLDGDDWIHPDCFEKLSKHMTPDVDIVISDYEEVNDQGFCSELILQHKKYEGILPGTEAIEDCYKGQIYPRVIWGKLYRKEVWENIRFNHMAYSEDTFAMFQILEQTRKLYSVNEPLYYYLQRGSSASRQKKTVEYENHVETLLHLYKKSLKQYPNVRSYAAEEYIGVAYELLKNYVRETRKKEALELIREMKFVYKTSNLSSSEFARKILKAPTYVIYLLICIKSR